MVKRRTGIDPLAYMGVEPTTPTQFVREARNPTTSDYDNFTIGAVWIVRGTNAVWMLVDKSDFIATWIQFTNNIAGVNTLTGNGGGAVPALAGNINVVGAAPYFVSGNPGLNTLTIEDDGTIATIYDTDSGVAVPSSNILNVIGGTGVTVTGSGNTVTINASSNNLQIQTDVGGPVSPTGSVLEVLGGDNITTTGIGPNIIQAAVSGTTDHAIQLGNASGSLTSVGPLTTGQVLIGVTGSDPNPARLTAGSNITIDDITIPGQITISSSGGGGGGGGVKVTIFNSSGTWTKDVDAKWIKVNIIGSGLGGGSGRQGISGAACGGAGGYPILGYSIEGDANSFGATESIVIGAGGLGGAAVTTPNTNGNNGSLSGQCSFGVLVTSLPFQMRGGAGGTATLSPNSGFNTSFSSTLGYYNYTNLGLNGGSNNSPTSTPPTINNGYPQTSVAARGGGCGGPAYTFSILSGSPGSNWLDYSNNIAIAGGTGGVESGTINGGNGNTSIGVTSIYSIVGGTGGGGGGGQSQGLMAGDGGDGGYPGGGGGGGGGSLNGTNSGAGGDGADGIIYVYEYL